MRTLTSLLHGTMAFFAAPIAFACPEAFLEFYRLLNSEIGWMLFMFGGLAIFPTILILGLVALIAPSVVSALFIIVTRRFLMSRTDSFRWPQICWTVLVLIVGSLFVVTVLYSEFHEMAKQMTDNEIVQTAIFTPLSAVATGVLVAVWQRRRRQREGAT